MCFGRAAVGIVALQTAFFRYRLVGVGARFDRMAEEAKVVALTGHPESVFQRALIIVASGASPGS
jgi:hypothetical protein